MISKRRLGATIALILAIGTPAPADEKSDVVRRAAELLEEIAATPDSGIPAQFLREAQGITIVPHLVDTQLGLGRKKGHGVYLARTEKGGWGAPEIVSMTGLSVGAEARREVTDLVVIDRTRKAKKEDLKHNLMVGIGFTIHGPVRHPRGFEGPGTDSKPEEKVLIYTRRRGLAVGVRFVGEYVARTALASDSKTAVLEPKSTDGNKAARADQPDQDSDLGGVAPEAARLKAALTTLTTSPATEVAAKGIKDPHVGQASGATAPARAASSPR